MSTKRKKIYNKEDIKSAQAELKSVEKYFTKKTSGRKTMQVRVGEKWYCKLKEISKSEKVMISFFLDRICEHFFKHYE